MTGLPAIFDIPYIMENLEPEFKTKNYPRILFFVFSAILVLSLAGNGWLIYKNKSGDSLSGFLKSSLVQPVLAEDIYPLFLCPCCGQPLDKKNICCDLAKERIDYIDSQVSKNFPEKEIILDYAKKYGINSFADQSKAGEIKEELLKTAPQDRPIISLNHDTFDFGDVSQKKGEVFHYFEIKNEGKTDLAINKLDSSCGCTSASVVFEGKEGPRFAMAGHGTESPTDWKISIPGGETAQLKVYYDPNVHIDFRGEATREIYIFSNDPIDFEKKATIELNQVD